MIDLSRLAAVVSAAVLHLLTLIIGAPSRPLHQPRPPVGAYPAPGPAGPAVVGLPEWQPGRPVRPDLERAWLSGGLRPPVKPG